MCRCETFEYLTRDVDCPVEGEGGAIVHDFLERTSGHQLQHHVEELIELVDFIDFDDMRRGQLSQKVRFLPKAIQCICGDKIDLGMNGLDGDASLSTWSYAE